MEYEPLMGKLVQHIARLFYDTPQIIFIDLLVKRTLIFDSEVAQLLKIVPKEFNKIVFKLKEDRIIKQETKIEHRENNYQEIKQAFYINYGEVKDVIKYKIFKMTKQLEIEMKKKEDLFICTFCKKEFGILEAQALMKNFQFECDECSNKLEESIKSSQQDPHNLYGLVMHTIQPVIEILKEIDKIEVPFLDYFQVLEIKKRKVEVDQPELIVNEIIEKEDLEWDSDNIDLGVNVSEVSVKEVSKQQFVKVNGNMKSMGEITEDDLQKMTESEYLEYFDKCR